jgi:enoyl-CoA hydratase
LAAEISANAPLALIASKRILQEQGDWPAAEMWEAQTAISEPVFTSEDAREGATAFAEKRPPVWRGR